MATYLERLKARRERVKAEIAQIEGRLAASHALGDTSSAQGISAGFSENLKWRQRLDALYSQLEMLDSQIEGTAAMGTRTGNIAIVRRAGL